MDMKTQASEINTKTETDPFHLGSQSDALLHFSKQVSFIKRNLLNQFTNKKLVDISFRLQTM